MKTFLKKKMPALYTGAWKLKEALRTGSFNQRWSNYYDAALQKNEWMHSPIPELVSLSLPRYIDTILDIGCASGRNFIPFNGKLKLWGVDIVPKRRIKWVMPFKDLTYEKATLQELTRRFAHERPDMSKVFVFESATFMYVPEEFQRRFFNICCELGCRNFMFRDFPPDSPDYPNDHIKIPLDNFNVAIDKTNPKLRIYTIMEG